MAGFLKNLWPVLLAIYIISPLDAHPLFFDDLIAAVAMFYMIYKNSRMKKQQQSYDQYFGKSGSRSQSGSRGRTASGQTMTLDQAFAILGVRRNDSLETISRTYRDKMSKSHPDKVSHLSDELQEKARELTLRLNEAYDVVKRYKA